MPVPYAKVIINPTAGGSSVRREWPRIKGQLQKTGLSFDYDFSMGTGHAIELAKSATEAGYGCLVAVGGDGTVNEIANGILSSSRPDKIILGILSAGSACNFARSLGLAQDFAGACSLLAGEGRAIIDVGVVECQSNGQTAQRYFVNTADVGLGSSIVDAWKRIPNHLGRQFNHVLRTVQGLKCVSKHQNRKIHLLEGEKVEIVHSCDIIIANGQYFANGMRIAPHAILDDGLLDVVSARELGRAELLKIWPNLYSGSHVRYPKITETKTASITLKSEEQLLVEADGVLVGTTPATFRVIPAALTVVV